MLTKLRRRFVLIMVALVGVVLAVMLLLSVLSSYQARYGQIQDSLNIALRTGEGADLRPWIGPEVGTRSFSFVIEQGPGAQNLQPVYVVSVNNASGQIDTNNNNVVMDPELLQTAIDRVLASGADNGILLDLGLGYARLVNSDSRVYSTRIAFADGSQLIAATAQQAGIAVLIYILAMLAMLGISLYLSKLALRPVTLALRQQRRFVADASHELKTPLTVILANNNLIMSHPERSTSQQMQWLESTQQEALRMDNLVRDLLLLAQMDEADDSDGPKPTTHLDFSALTERSLLQFEALFYERKVMVLSQIEPGIWVSGFPQRLTLLLAILLDNASKYATFQGQVEVRLEKQGQGSHRPKALLRVQNTSKPLSTQELEQLFGRFYRGSAARTSSAEGSGLGLSLAKAIVEEHRGSIKADSRPQAGREMSIEEGVAAVLPATEDLGAERRTDENRAVGQRQDVKTLDVPASALTILEVILPVCKHSG